MEKIDLFIAGSLNDIFSQSLQQIISNFNSIEKHLFYSKSDEIIRMIELYMKIKEITDLKEHLDDEILKGIALQKFGKSGYTVFMENETVLYLSPQYRYNRN